MEEQGREDVDVLMRARSRLAESPLAALHRALYWAACDKPLNDARAVYEVSKRANHLLARVAPRLPRAPMPTTMADVLGALDRTIAEEKKT